MTSIFFLAALSLGGWVYLALLRGGFWRGDQVLVNSRPPPATWPEVAIVIPARNEANVVERAVSSHLAASYQGRLFVIVVDDHSEDGTGDVIRRISTTGARGISISSVPPLEAGWTGKLWALQHGLSVAGAKCPHAKYVLLTDADIVYESHVLSDLVVKAESEGLSLVSLMARLDARGFWASLLIPPFVFFFQKLYPFAWVNDRNMRIAAAAGGCMLVRRDDLVTAGGVAEIRGQIIDDCALARLIKDTLPRRGIWLGLAHDVESLRDNRKLADIRNMVVRTAFTQLDHSVVLLAGTIFGMALLYGVPPFVVLSWPAHQNVAALMTALSAWGVMSAVFAPTLRLYDRSPLIGLALPVAGVLYGMMTAVSAWRHWRGRGVQWKGRRYRSLASGRGRSSER